MILHNHQDLIYYVHKLHGDITHFRKDYNSDICNHTVITDDKSNAQQIVRQQRYCKADSRTVSYC